MSDTPPKKKPIGKALLILVFLVFLAFLSTYCIGYFFFNDAERTFLQYVKDGTTFYASGLVALFLVLVYVFWDLFKRILNTILVFILVSSVIIFILKLSGSSSESEYDSAHEATESAQEAEDSMEELEIDSLAQEVENDIDN